MVNGSIIGEIAGCPSLLLIEGAGCSALGRQYPSDFDAKRSAIKNYMTEYKIKFIPHEKEVSVAGGETVIRAAMAAGVHINASCGGEGVCGKCRVIVETGKVDGGISEKLSREDIDKGYRLACLSKVKSDLLVRIPVESTVDAGVLNQVAIPRKTARIKERNLEELKEKGLFVPPVEKIYLDLAGAIHREQYGRCHPDGSCPAE